MIVFISCFVVLLHSISTSKHIETNRYTLDFEDLPSSFDGFKVAVLADFQIGLYTKEKDIDYVIEQLDVEKPDVVFILGDHIYSAPHKFNYYNPKHLESIKNVFSKISSKFPTYAVNGNHDNWENKDGIIKATIDSGVGFLDNRHVWFTNQNNTNERIHFSGVGDLDTDIIDIEAAISNVYTNDFSILLSHNPKVITSITNQNYDEYVDLMLAGHTHAGQINIPFVVDPFLKPAHKYGFKNYGDTILYITSGVGMVLLPMRFNAKAEIAIITLQKIDFE